MKITGTTISCLIRKAAHVGCLVPVLLAFAACSSADIEEYEHALQYEYFFRYVKDSDYENVTKALQNGVCIDQRDYAGEQAIHWAVTGYKDLKMVRLLLDHGANINARNRDGDTPLLLLVYFGTEYEDSKVFRFLLQKGADVHAANNQGTTALHRAASAVKYRWSVMLIQQGANVNARDNSGNTPLHFAAHDRPEITALLLQHGAEANPMGSLFATPLRRALLCDDEKSAALLRQHGGKDFAILPLCVHHLYNRIFMVR